jgi:hypothetical protein
MVPRKAKPGNYKKLEDEFTLAPPKVIEPQEEDAVLYLQRCKVLNEFLDMLGLEEAKCRVLNRQKNNLQPQDT